LASAKACSPSRFNCACETPPTYWVRPVGEVVVAQAATRAVASNPARNIFVFIAFDSLGRRLL
jgi:hypothetical protein